MDAEEAWALSWITGTAGLVATLTLQALYWWQAFDAPAGRDAFFLRSTHSLPPALLWFLHALLHTGAPGHADIAGGGAATAGHGTGSRAALLPHTALLSASLAAAVSLAGLGLTLLPYAGAHTKRRSIGSCAFAAAVGIIASALPLPAWIPSLATSRTGLPLAAAAIGVLLPALALGQQLSLLLRRGFLYPGSTPAAVAELASSLAWVGYGASSGDWAIEVSFLVLALLQLGFLLALLLVERLGVLSTARAEAEAEGYEMVPAAERTDSVSEHEAEQELQEGIAPAFDLANHPNSLNYDDVDQRFDEWLQADMLSGKRML